MDGRDVIAFCSNDYLGLAADPRLCEAAREGVARYGVGGGASHLILGHSEAHHALELALAQFVSMPRALLFSTGYMANLGVVTALVGRGDAVFADKLNHASLNDACQLSRAQFKRYAHNDLTQLEQLLATTKARRKLIAVDAVFSMDGDIAPVRELVALAKSKPGELRYSTAGQGSAIHLAGALFGEVTKTNLVQLPYKGSPPAVIAVIICDRGDRYLSTGVFPA